jgi:hypothetical protein
VDLAFGSVLSRSSPGCMILPWLLAFLGPRCSHQDTASRCFCETTVIHSREEEVRRTRLRDETLDLDSSYSCCRAGRDFAHSRRDQVLAGYRVALRFRGLGCSTKILLMLFKGRRQDSDKKEDFDEEEEVRDERYFVMR